MVENCPYKNFKKNFSFFGQGRDAKVEEKTKEINHSIKSCALKNEEDDALSVQMSEAGKSELKDTKSTRMSVLNSPGPGNCPFGYGDTAANSNRSDKEKEAKCPYSGEKIKVDDTKKGDTKEEDLSDDDDQPAGGCPVMNKTKNDPGNKHYERVWELPQFGTFDFMFEMRGLLANKDWKEKTQKIRSYGRHMLYTLFNQNDEKLNTVRSKEFPMVFFIYDDIKTKGNKLFKKGKLKEALDYYFYVSKFIFNLI